MAKKSIPTLSVTTLTHGEATRKNIPTAEYQSVMKQDEQAPVRIAYARGAADRQGEEQIDLFADFNGLPDDNARTELYRHDAHWANRMILGDSLQVMASLAEREGLRGQVQCIYFDPPYGIKFNSNFQWSTTSRDVKDGNTEHITREPEQVKAFRDAWRDGHGQTAAELIAARADGSQPNIWLTTRQGARIRKTDVECRQELPRASVCHIRSAINRLIRSAAALQ